MWWRMAISCISASMSDNSLHALSDFLIFSYFYKPLIIRLQRGFRFKYFLTLFYFLKLENQDYFFAEEPWGLCAVSSPISVGTVY